MFVGLPLFPEQASSFAADVDALYFFIIAVSAFFAVLISILVLIFAVKYRRRHDHEVGAPIEGSLPLELAWSIIPTIIAMVMFAWGAHVFYDLRRPPAEAHQIYAVGKQWMWKFQHPEGPREINELHVPTGRPVRIMVTSEDVIHSLYFPSFRTKIDAIPGRYTELWFEPTKPGRYHIFCAEYCGTMHSGMIGTVVVLEPSEYQAWLSDRVSGAALAAAPAAAPSGVTPVGLGLPADGAPAGPALNPLVQQGAQLFTDHACVTCHNTAQGLGPQLNGIFGHSVELTTGQSVVVDEAYIRESILNPQAKVVAGYLPMMPAYQGLISEEGILALIEYIKSLEPAAAPAAAPQGDRN